MVGLQELEIVTCDKQTANGRTDQGQTDVKSSICSYLD